MHPGLITGLFNLGSSIIGGVSNAIGQSSANKMAMQQMNEQIRQNDIAFERQRQLIKEQNDYNSPANQARLMREAGLNPMLMYQHGTESAQSEIATPITPEVPLLRGNGEIAADSVNQGLNTLLSLAQLDVLKSQARKNNSEATGKDIENQYSDEIIQQKLRQGEVNIELGIQEVDETIARISNIHASSLNLYADLGLKEEQAKLMEAQLTTEQLTQARLLLEQEGIKATNELIRLRAVAQELENSLFALRKTLMEADVDFKQADALVRQWEANYRYMYHTEPGQGVEQFITDGVKHIGGQITDGLRIFGAWLSREGGNRLARNRADSTTD